ncbi:hypothetical protein JCM11641_001746 [Rhodosporidiobolus odoratus]
MSSSPFTFSYHVEGPARNPTDSSSLSSRRPCFARSASVASSVFSGTSNDRFWASNRDSIGDFSCLTAATSHDGSSLSGTDDACPRAVMGQIVAVEEDQDVHATAAALQDANEFRSDAGTSAPTLLIPRTVSKPRFERRSINRSLKHSGLPSSPSTPVFPLRTRGSSPAVPLRTLSDSIVSYLPTTEPLASPTRSFASTGALPDHPYSLRPSPPLSSPSRLALASTELAQDAATSLCTEVVEAPQPYRQRLRWAGDMFTPEWVRGKGQMKEGWCSACGEAEVATPSEDVRGGEAARSPGSWFKLKDASYWFHMTFIHGVSSRTGRPFDSPAELRYATPGEDADAGVEGLCDHCHEWKAFEITRPDTTVVSRMPWFAHAHACHQPNRKQGARSA